MKPTYFQTAGKLRAWLEEHHDSADELWVGLYKKHTGRPSVTWSEVVDEALCFGWIDGVRKSIDEDRYANRLTPRRANFWSAVNVRRFEALRKEGRVHPAGLRAFERRRTDTTASYSYERRHDVELDPAFVRRFRSERTAREWFEAQPDGYRTNAVYWVMSAKRPETRERRLATLIADSSNGRRVAPLTSPSKRS